MIVLLDATALVSDPMCAGTAWRALAHAANAWRVRVIVSRVVLAEAVAGYRRHVDEALVGFERWSDKHMRKLGLAEASAAMKDAMNASRDSYHQRLPDILTAAGIEIVDPAAISHMELVERATTRMRPCDNNGNGYRDALNWLTVLSVAEQNPADEICWVTDNTKDFANAEATALHEDLVSDLESRNLSNRVRWLRNTQELVLQLAQAYAPELSPDLREVYSKLREATVLGFIGSDVLPSAIDRSVDARRCGLPLSTISAQIESIVSPRGLQLTVGGSVTADEAVAEFSVEADVVLSVTVGSSAGMEPDQIASLPSEVPPWVIPVVKPLVFRGIVALGPHERPLSGELMQIEARSDDPGLPQWANLDEVMRSVIANNDLLKSVLGDLPATVLASDYLRNIAHPVLPPDYLKFLRAPVLSPDYLKFLKASVLPPDYLKFLKTPVLPPNLLLSDAIPNILRDLPPVADEPSDEERGRPNPDEPDEDVDGLDE